MSRPHIVAHTATLAVLLVYFVLTGCHSSSKTLVPTVAFGKVPAAYQESRIGALRRELDDVQRDFDQLAATEVRAVDSALRERSLEPIPTVAVTAAVESQPPTTAAPGR